VEKPSDIDVVARSLARPSGYAAVRLGMSLHPKQAQVLDALFRRDKTRVLFICGNEVGKTSRVAVAAILYALEVRNARVQVTSGSFRQLREQLMPSLSARGSLYPDYHFMTSAIQHAGVNRALLYSARDEGTFQGFHSDDGVPQLIICDEAAAVSDAILRAAEDRCNPTWLLVMGSPLDPTGHFYRMGRELSQFYDLFTLSKVDCTKDKGGWIEPMDVARLIAKNCGLSIEEAMEIVLSGDHRGAVRDRLTLSTVFAEFSSFVDDSLLTLAEWHKCVENPPAFVEGERHAFCDFAAGRARNVLAVRNGNRAWIEKKWTEPNEMAAVGDFLLSFRRLKKEIGLKPEEIDGDGDGLGGPMVARLQELGWPINDFHGGSKPRFFPERYQDAWTEAWSEGAGRIKACDIILPRDAEFQSQALARKVKPVSTGRMKLETKEDMRRRNLASPDEADALFCAIMPPMQLRSYATSGQAGAQGFAEQLAEYNAEHANEDTNIPGGRCD